MFLIVLLFILNGCKKNEGLSDSSAIKKSNSALKVNSSKKDLAEIMLYQDYYKDTTSLSKDVYSRLLYVRSDGTIAREQEIVGQFDVSWMKVSNNGQYWTYTSDIRSNLEVAYIPDKTTKKVFDGTENPIGPDGKKIKLQASFDHFNFYKNSYLFSAGLDNIMRYNLKTGKKDFINLKNSCFWPLIKSETECYYSGFLPNSKDDEVKGKPKRAIYHFDFNTKKETLKKILPFKHRVEHRGISENGEVVVFEKENTKTDEDAWDEFVNDSLFVFMNDFKDSFSIAIFENLRLLNVGPNGNWIYFRYNNAIHRINIETLRKNSEWKKDELIQNSECVYIQDGFIKNFKIQSISSVNG